MPNNPIRDYRDLLVWQVAMDLALACEPMCEALPRRAWRLATQIRNAANSVHANIAEGNGSFSTADYIRHLGMSNKSLRELESHLTFVSRQYHIAGTATALRMVTRVAMLLRGLVRSLERKLREE